LPSLLSIVHLVRFFQLASLFSSFVSFSFRPLSLFRSPLSLEPPSHRSSVSGVDVGFSGEIKQDGAKERWEEWKGRSRWSRDSPIKGRVSESERGGGGRSTGGEEEAGGGERTMRKRGRG
jgi:hypothetical protein